jgi:hypothetical protein
MKFDGKYKPSFAMLFANFDQGESIMHCKVNANFLSV